MHVGFVGLGNMGGPMADWLLKAKLPLVVHDIRREAAAPSSSRGLPGPTLPQRSQRSAMWSASACPVRQRCRP